MHHKHNRSGHREDDYEMPVQDPVSNDVATSNYQRTPLDDKLIIQQLERENEPWLKAYWRPAMGWLYMLICAFDFIVFPAISMLLPAILLHWGIDYKYQPWTSLTLQNGGMIHLAFGAILGVAAWTRGQEKIAMIAN